MVAWILWIAGTATGLLTAVLIPFRLFTKFPVRPDGAFGGWLMPVVPPMVSATAGAFLLPTISSQNGARRCCSLVMPCSA